ncbi:plasmid stabilization system family protein (plasmid) [Ochrobactrum quorumnocens]|uniref:Plasmid stabilization system family protein n=1 Tax=Ochrobactrum quorumnocens TaxID=271865 RepID=A0A248UPU5_9HYPH|nr:type II toxin-antitoxin system RelE/ParE family toxin [[Ochrobactrum] quorumnocens]ASV88755.1 plasmid stabilization system family protein [[Ochrobactrum] quorumnocens]
MTEYSLEFHKAARKEWSKLDANTRKQFAAKLQQRLSNPHVPGDRLSGSRERYKIKLRSIGYRLVYEVLDGRLIVLVLAVGRRDKSDVYERAHMR